MQLLRAGDGRLAACVDQGPRDGPKVTSRACRAGTLPGEGTTLQIEPGRVRYGTLLEELHTE